MEPVIFSKKIGIISLTEEKKNISENQKDFPKVFLA